MAEGKKGTH